MNRLAMLVTVLAVGIMASSAMGADYFVAGFEDSEGYVAAQEGVVIGYSTQAEQNAGLHGQNGWEVWNSAAQDPPWYTFAEAIHPPVTTLLPGRLAATPPGDLDADNFVGGDDLDIVLGHWGRTSPLAIRFSAIRPATALSAGTTSTPFWAGGASQVRSRY